MDYFLFLLIIIFVTINIVQVWLILTFKLLIRGGMIIGALEILELPLAIYLILKGGITGFLTVIPVEIIQWTVVAYFSTRGRIK